MLTIILIIVAIVSLLVLIGVISKWRESVKKEDAKFSDKLKSTVKSLAGVAILGIVAVTCISVIFSDDDTKEVESDTPTVEIAEEQPDNKFAGRMEFSSSFDDSMNSSKIEIAEMNKALRTTRPDIYNYLNRKDGINITDFPSSWSGWSLAYEIKRVSRVSKEGVVVYLITYPIEYNYRGDEKNAQVKAMVLRDIRNDSWRTRDFAIPKFEDFYKDTPEGMQ